MLITKNDLQYTKDFVAAYLIKSKKIGPDYIIAPKTKVAKLKCQQRNLFTSALKIIREKGFTMIIRWITTFYQISLVNFSFKGLG